MTRLPIRVFFLAATCTAGCAGSGDSRRPAATHTARLPSVDQRSPHISNPRPQPQSQTIGASVQGRAIELSLFGPWPALAGNSVLIIGGIHGNENSSVTVAQKLGQHLRGGNLRPNRQTVALIENANPDGFAQHSRNNSRGVDVNRNFPAKNFRPARGGVSRGGTVAGSEPETQAIMRAIELVRPTLLIAIHSIDDGKHCNNFDGPARRVAEAMSRYNKYPVEATIGYPTPGSLGSYAGIDRQIGVITLELPRSASGEQAWAANREALLAAIAEAAQ